MAQRSSSAYGDANMAGIAGYWKKKLYKVLVETITVPGSRRCGLWRPRGAGCESTAEQSNVEVELPCWQGFISLVATTWLNTCRSISSFVLEQPGLDLLCGSGDAYRCEIASIHVIGSSRQYYKHLPRRDRLLQIRWSLREVVKP